MLHVQLLNVDCGGLRDYKQDQECHFPIKDRVELTGSTGSRAVCKESYNLSPT